MARMTPISRVRSTTLIESDPIKPMPPTKATMTARASSIVVVTPNSLRASARVWEVVLDSYTPISISRAS